MRGTDTFQLYDTTLRDGAQAEGISYSVEDKLAVAHLLDELGVGFIEGGWPGALPTDTEFFRRMSLGEISLKHAQLVAFGATRRADRRVQDDPQVHALLASDAPVVTLVAKSDLRHVHQALRTTPEENLRMVADTVQYLVQHDRRVFLDCEHFFDGYLHDNSYGVRLLQVACDAGAEVGVLCDTNGGMLPMQLQQVVSRVAASLDMRIGIHCQDDTACAVANTLAAVEAGASHAQCTANGYGERTGNADLFAVAAGLETKLDRRVLPSGGLERIGHTSRAIAEIANVAPQTHQAYVGASAFAHKAGLHASAIKVNPELYNHMSPETVGNTMRILVTEMAGRASIELKARELGVDLSAGGHDAEEISRRLTSLTQRIKELESAGWSFEAADASFELLLMRELRPEQRAPFELLSYRVTSEKRASQDESSTLSEATVKLRVTQQEEKVIATAEGIGPVRALDAALRSALLRAFPMLERVHLVDYKVRILDGRRGTDSVTRVLIESTDGERRWTTVGVDSSVIEASWRALSDAYLFALKEG